MKAYKILGSAFALALLGFTLNACELIDELHTHQYSSEYKFDENYHWLPVTCGHQEAIEKSAHTFSNSDGNSSKCQICGYKIGMGTVDNSESIENAPKDYDEIYTVEELKAISGSNKKYVLMNDLDAKDEEWVPINDFSGELDGQGYSIEGINVTKGTDNIGLFSTLKGKVSNLNVTAAIEFSTEYLNIGILCGTNNGQIDNVNVSGSISVQYSNNIGGIAGRSNNSLITNSTSNATLNGYQNIGGVVGYLVLDGTSVFEKNKNNGSVKGELNTGGVIGKLYCNAPKSTKNTYVNINDVENNGSVTSTGECTGGILGYQTSGVYYSAYYSYLSMKNCVNNFEVKAEDYTGGIIGYAEYLSEIKSSKNNSNITGGDYTGGYVGRALYANIYDAVNNNTITGNAHVGGVAGSTGNLYNCKNNGELVINKAMVDGESLYSYVGGIAGYATLINGCENTANIEVTVGGMNVGGLVGYLYLSPNTECSDNINYGEVINNANSTGGLIGKMYCKSPSSTKNTSINFEKNINEGEVQSSGNWVGGLVGLQDSGTYYSYYNNYAVFSNCENKANVTGNNYVGGIIGSGNYVESISVCKNIGNIKGVYCVGGYAGYSEKTTFKNLENENSVEGSAYLGGIAGSGGYFYNCLNKGSINCISTYLNDGVLIGYIGGVTGFARYIQDCTNESNITIEVENNYIGGIVGHLYAENDTRISGNINKGNINVNANYVGGIVGRVKCDITTVHQKSTVFSENQNLANVTSTGSYVGGIVGYQYSGEYYLSYNYMTINNCENNGDISGDKYVGGLLGQGKTVIVTEAILNTNTVTGTISAKESFGKYYGSANQ